MKKPRNENKIINLFLLLSFLLLISCGNNQICVDLEYQTLHSKNNDILQKIIIKEKEGEMVFITKKEGKRGLSSLNLTKMDTTNFNYKNSLLTEKVKSFSLHPNSVYEITNQTIGDASEGILLIKTNEKGQIFYSNSVCN